MATTKLQAARTKAARSTSSDLWDTGVAVAIRLNTDPVTLSEAAATLAFIKRCVNASVKASHAQLEDVELVPVVEIGSGSLDVKIRFSLKVGGKKKGKKKGQGPLKEIGIEALKEFAKEAAKQAAIILVGALALLGGIKFAQPPEPQKAAPPAVVMVVAKEIRPSVIELRHELGQSGKPWTLDVKSVDGGTIKLGPPRPLDMRGRSFDFK